MATNSERHLDLVWPPEHGDDQSQAPTAGRLWIGIHYECCDVYARTYREPNDSKYVGRCPRCQREVLIRVGPGGVSSRLFRAKLI